MFLSQSIPFILGYGCDKRLLYVSSYRDIGRAEWKTRPRSEQNYASYFKLFQQSQGAQHTLLYIDPLIAQRMNLHNTTRLTILSQRDISNSIYERYIAKEGQIMRSMEYKRLIPVHLRSKAEFSRPEYTMVNHEKIAIFDDAVRRMTNYSHLVWIYFGAIREMSYAPAHINVCKIPDDKILASNANTILDDVAPVSLTDMYKQPQYFSADTGTSSSKFPKDPICGTILFFPRGLISNFRRLYEAELQRWQTMGIAHYDQAMFLQLHKASKGSLFHLWSPPNCVKGGLLRCRMIFKYHLNRNHSKC